MGRWVPCQQRVWGWFRGAEVHWSLFAFPPGVLWPGLGEEGKFRVRSGLEYHLCSLPVRWWRASGFSLLSISFLICDMGWVRTLTSGGAVKLASDMLNKMQHCFCFHKPFSWCNLCPPSDEKSRLFCPLLGKRQPYGYLIPNTDLLRA